jgi:hypothetical protein
MSGTPRSYSSSKNFDAAKKDEPHVWKWVGETEISQGNINNNHFHLTNFIGKIPLEIIGGANKTALAKSVALIDWGGIEPVETDIAGDKNIFRKRGWVGKFYKLNRAKVGDFVVLEKGEGLHYRVSIKHAPEPSSVGTKS